MNSEISLVNVIGDSHVDVFSGYNYIQPEWPRKSNNKIPLFKTFRLGAVLAFNISDHHHPSYKKLMKCMATLPNQATIMLMAGEVDCRVHFVKQATLQHKTISQVAEFCATKYFNLIKELKRKKFNMIVCAVLPSTPFVVNDSEYPTVGTFNERNEAAKAFNESLERLCKKNNIQFVSIYQKLYLGDKPDTKYFIDSIHLSTASIPLYLEAFTKIEGISKEQLNLSAKIEFSDLARQTLKRKTLSFWLQRSTFYPTIQKCVHFLKKHTN
jgi:hypothetical protein